MKKKSRILHAFLSTVMVLGLMSVPSTIHAQILRTNNRKEAAMIQDMTTPGSYKLTADIALSETMSIREGDVYDIDLNGHKITSSITNSNTELTSMFQNYGDLTISDSSENKTGTIQIEALFGFRNYGNLTINSGNFISNVIGSEYDGGYNGRIIYSSGKLMVNGGSFHATCGVINATDTAETYINGGELYSTSSNATSYYTYCVNNSGIMYVKNATIAGVQGGLAGNKGKLYVYSGNFSTDWENGRSFYALYVAGEYGVSEAEIYGGNFISKRPTSIGNDNTGGDGGINADASVKIYGGSFIGKGSPITFAKETAKDPQILGGRFITRTSAASSDTPYPKENMAKLIDSSLVDYDETTGTVKSKVQSIQLDKEKAAMKVGASISLTVNIQPSYAFDKTVTWSSNNPKIANVDTNGKVTAVAPGTAIIHAKGENGKEASCTVTVMKPVVSDTPSVDTTKPSDEIKIGVNDEKADHILKEAANQIIAGAESFTDAETAKAVVKAAEEGKAVTVAAEWKAADTSSSDVKADAQKIQRELEALTAQNENTAAVAMYLDLHIQIKADDEELGFITSLNEPITFTLMIPEKLQEEGRDFYILRVHDDTVEKIVPIVNGNILTFKTDRFSTYALVYVDKKPEDSGSTPQQKPETPEKTIYNVVFVDVNGAVLKTEKVEANGFAAAPAAPSIKGYRFVKWDTDFTKVTRNLLVKPIYEKAVESEKPSTPAQKPSGDQESLDTGDSTDAGLLTVVGLLGLVSMGIIVIQRKRKMQ